MPDDRMQALVELPQLFQDADNASCRAQRRHLWWVSTHIALIVTAGLLAAVTSSLEPGSVKALGGVLSTIAFAFGLVFSLLLALRREDSVWYLGRAVAESAKTLAWRYMVRAQPFDTSDSEASNRLLQDLNQLVRMRPRLAGEVVASRTGSGEITPSMRQARGLSLSERIALYRQHRLEQQNRWYAAAARRNQRAARQWFTVVVALQLCALGLAVLRVGPLDSSVPKWVSGQTAALFITAATTWLQTRRHQE